MGGKYLTQAGREQLHQWLWAIAIGSGAYIFFAWDAGIGLIDSINALGQFAIWAILLSLVARALYLPVQCIRHSYAVRKEKARVRQITEGKTAQDRILAHIVPSNYRDPTEIPWWRW
jgi:hypothetical protein